MKTKVHFQNIPPSPLKFQNGILVYDKVLEKHKSLRSWIRKFPRRYGVKSGEKLKSLDELPKHVKKIMKLSEGYPLRDITIVTLGGGSVGDFGGFVASILKRGVRLIHIPSTWLSAMDSAHGGKTGLNVGKVKNQIGTFFPAQDVYIVRSILLEQPNERAFEAFGEAFKVALLDGGRIWRQLKDIQAMEPTLYWRWLPDLIRAKYKIVDQDPQEQKGIRHLLNLGHTMGHVWEAQLKIPHGIAILFGLAFALEWSFHRGLLSSKTYYDIRLSGAGSFLPDRLDLRKIILETKNPKKFLLHDKKLTKAKKIRFIFIQSPGQAAIESVSMKELEVELDRQIR